jgi:argininosuccinate lyase
MINFDIFCLSVRTIGISFFAILFVHSYAWAWKRDYERLAQILVRVKQLPLGSGALAGNPFNIDRDFLAKELGFVGLCPNSLDAVSDRDFVAEFCFWATMTMVHISQWSEDLIIFAGKKQVVIADAYSTGSSLMPQKKNPDALELLRGKTGRVTGSLIGILTVLKGLPRAYNKDLQEDKEGMFDACDTMKGCLPIAAGVLATLKPDGKTMARDLAPEMLATDLAEYLVRKGVPFRETHHIAGAAVKLAEDRGVPLSDLKHADLLPLHAKFEQDVEDIFNFETSVESRSTFGGTSRSSVEKQIALLKEWIEAQ